MKGCHSRSATPHEEAGDIPHQYFYRTRYYDTFVGRFLSEDGLRRPRQSAYPYAAHNPALFVDPLGLDAGGANQGATCIARAGQHYKSDLKFCKLERAWWITKKQRAPAALVACLKRNPSTYKKCYDQFKDDLFGPDPYAECVAEALIIYKNNIQVCCWGGSESDFDHAK